MKQHKTILTLLNFIVLACVAIGTTIWLSAEKNHFQKERSDSKITIKSAADEPVTEKQRVVLLAGPHKTSSSSIQLNMLHWLNDDDHASGLAKNWAWPSTAERFQEDGCTVEDGREDFQIFYWWIQAMKGSFNVKCMSGNEKIYTRSEMIEKYRRAFFDHWQKGSSLVIASEAMDFIASERYADPAGLLENIIGSLPWHANYPPTKASGSDDDITVVVSYRAPRSTHLISLWHQCCMKKMSFHEYLTNRVDVRPDPLKSLDSLKLAKVFLDRGLKVILIDMAGVKANGYDMSIVIACDILGANCTPEKRFFGASEEDPAIANVKPHSESNFDVTQDQLERIEELIQNYDCNYLSLLQNENFTVLYSHSLKQIFDFCQEHVGDRIKNRKDLANKIVAVAKD